MHGEKVQYCFSLKEWFECVCVCVCLCVCVYVCVKRVVNLKQKICREHPCPQAIQNVDEFVYSLNLEKCSIPWLAQQSSAVNGCRQNVVDLDLFLTNTQLLASQDINWWTAVVWIVIFLSAILTLILTAPIHCRGSVNWWIGGSIGEHVIECLISPKLEEETNTSKSWKTRGWRHFQKCNIFLSYSDGTIYCTHYYSVQWACQYLKMPFNFIQTGHHIVILWILCCVLTNVQQFFSGKTDRVWETKYRKN